MRTATDPTHTTRPREPRAPTPSGPAPRRPSAATNLVIVAVVVLVVAALIGLVVRSGGLDRSAEPAGGAATGATGAAEEVAPGAPTDDVVTDHDGAAGAGGSLGGERAPELGRIIRTAELSITVARDTFDARFGDAVDVAETNGGFVADSRSRERSGNLTIRVPAASFGTTLRELRELGTVEVESVRGQDVTAEVVDLQARLRISQARRDVLLGLMAEARTIPQTIRVQNALDDTQVLIEQIQGQLRLLDDRTSLATIHLDLREEGAEPDPETPSIPNAFERAIAGSVGVIAAVVIGLGYLLPLMVLGLLGWLVVARIRRRRG